LYPLPTTVFYRVRQDHRIKPVSAFLPASPVGEQSIPEKSFFVRGANLDWGKMLDPYPDPDPD
jgi:hypothetical protein